MNLTVSLSMPGLDRKIKYLMEAATQGLEVGVSDASLTFWEAAREKVAVETGHLRDSIVMIRLVNELTRQTIVITPVGLEPAPNKWGIDPPYARRIEFGFIGSDSLGRMYHQAAQPYMRPAYEENKEKAAGEIKQGPLDALAAARRI